jgi:hypothetical protein
VSLSKLFEMEGARQSSRVLVRVGGRSGCLYWKYAPSSASTDEFLPQYATTAAAVYTPPSLLAPPKRTSFSVTLARNHVERLYVICPPQVWEKVLRGNFARIWRWESPSTWKWCTVRSTSISTLNEVLTSNHSSTSSSGYSTSFQCSLPSPSSPCSSTPAGSLPPPLSVSHNLKIDPCEQRTRRNCRNSSRRPIDSRSRSRVPRISFTISPSRRRVVSQVYWRED